MVCFISLSLSVNMTVEVKKSVFGCEVGASGQGQPYPNEIPFRVPKQNPGSCILFYPYTTSPHDKCGNI